MVQGRESLLATLQTGDLFGEVSLFDTGPRSADVVANADSLLLKISADAFQKLAVQHPELAAPFLLAVGRTMTARLRASNKRYQDSLLFARTSSAG
jgi:CRP-like cAMP-binding protein